MYAFKQLILTDGLGEPEAEVSRFHGCCLLSPGVWAVKVLGDSKRYWYVLDDMPDHWIQQIAKWSLFTRRRVK